MEHLIDLRDISIRIRTVDKYIFVNDDIYTEQEILEMAKALIIAGYEMLDTINVQNLKG